MSDSNSTPTAIPDCSKLSSSTASVTARPGVGTDSPGEPFAHLYRMSPTAGVATTDYAAINSLSIVALLLGLAGVLALFAEILLIVPAIGLVLGLISFVQINGSNRTQTGRGFAAMGILLALIFGGFIIGHDYFAWKQKRGAENQIAELIAAEGKDLVAGKFDQAYQRFSDRFRARVSPEEFKRSMATLNTVPRLGSLSGLQWNHENMMFEVNPDSGDQTVTAMIFFQFDKSPEPQREYAKFTRDQNAWVIEDLPQVFPSARSRPGGPPGAAGARQGP